MSEQRDQSLTALPPISQTQQQTQTKTQTTSPLKGIIEAQYAARDAAAKDAALKQKYASIDSLKRADKIQALKNTKLNPYRLANPYDGLANSLHRWKTVAGDAVLSHYTEEQKQAVASHYYDKMIGPMYGGMNIAPMSKELWMKQAYKEASNYNIEDSYNNSIMHSLKHGWDEGLPSLARAGQYVYNIIGNTVETAMQQYQHEKAWRAQPTTQRQADLAKPWHEQAVTLHNQIASVTHNSKLDQVVNRGAQRQTEEHEFWAAALPNYDGWLNHATSFVAEQAAQLPMYVAMGEASGAAKEANLTEKLLSSDAGKKVFSYLMAGTEGYAYGKATRPQEDKGQAWQDAVGFTVFHGLFDIGGGITKKLSEVVSGPAKEALERHESKLALAQEGKRPATSAERYEDHKAEVGANLAVAGIPGQRAIFAEALAHVAKMEKSGMGKDGIKDYEMGLLNEDPARHAPVFSSATYVRSLLSATGKKLSDIEPGSEDEKFISSRLAQLIVDAGASLNTNVKGVQEQAEATVAKEAQTSGTKKTLDFYKAKVVSELAKDPAALKMVKPEQVEKMAQAKMALDQKKAAAIAERKLTQNPAKEATSIALRDKTVPSVKVRSERTTDRFGQPAVRYSVNPEYKVQLNKYQKESYAQGKSLGQFFQGMSDDDFKNDLTTHFYPKVLRNAGIFFEGQNTKEGYQRPNFLAFMYNYTHQMPREFGKELEARFIDSMKVQKYMSGRKPTEPQLMYFAKAMYNHVDNFLGSGRWPQEANIFRSTQDDLWHSTEWQQQLLKEKEVQEKKNLRDMFSGDPKARRAALVAHQLLSAKRAAEYAKGPKDMASQERISGIDDEIDKLQTPTKDYEGWVF